MNIYWTDSSKVDLKRLYDFLNSVNPPVAKKVMQILKHTTTHLYNHPFMGEQLTAFLPREIRRLIVNNYEIRYEIQKQTIFILRIWHTRENRLI